MYLSVQYLRGIAALAVVAKHASHPGGSLERALDGGADLFFLISGFVMVVSTHGQKMGPATFLAKRARRILPMWWVTLAVVAALGIGSGSAGEWMWSAALVPSWVAYGVGAVSWGVGWTLVFEAVFYLVFALGLAFRSDRFVIYALLALVAVGLMFGRGQAPVLNTLLHPLLLEFLMGAIVARIALSKADLPTGVIVLSLLFGMVLYATGTVAPVPYEFRPITRGLPLALIFTGIIYVERTRPFPDIAIFRLFGDASYSIYLLHYLPIMAVWLVVPKDTLWPVTAALAVACGCLAYLHIERPLLNMLRPRPTAAA